jgi:hypothetical protein
MVLQAPIPQLAKSNDYKAVQADVGDQSACIRELPKDSTARKQLQPNNPDVV